MSESDEGVSLRSVEFSTGLVPWMKSCLKNGGVPTFRTRYARIELEDSLVGVCYGAASSVRSVLFTNVPREDLEAIRTTSPDWIYLATKYGDQDLKDLARRIRSL